MKILALALAASTLAHGAAAQSNASAPTPVGTWRGTSICTLRPSPCNDEVVVYRFTTVTRPDSLSLDARKIVRGQEEEMGVLGCNFVARGARVTCTMPNGEWHFTIRGDSLVGDLTLPDQRKYRDVRTVRAR